MIMDTFYAVREAYIRHVGEGKGHRIFQFFQKNFVAKGTIELIISWPVNFFEKKINGLPSILVSYLRIAYVRKKTCLM